MHCSCTSLRTFGTMFQLHRPEGSFFMLCSGSIVIFWQSTSVGSALSSCCRVG
jgi:hypothetical protein